MTLYFLSKHKHENLHHYASQ